MATRTFIAKLEDREVTIEVDPLGASLFRVRAGDGERTIDARALAGNRLSLLVDGVHYEVSVARAGDDYDVLLAQRRFAFRLLTEEKARRAAARSAAETHGRQEIKASMPGKVVDILVKPGDAVEAKQGILIIEAMKMENEIKSTGAGSVSEVCVTAGQAVEAGELLIVIE